MVGTRIQMSREKAFKSSLARTAKSFKQSIKDINKAKSLKTKLRLRKKALDRVKRFGKKFGVKLRI